MMNLGQIDVSALTIIKIGLIMTLLIYVVFSLIVVKQVAIMTDTLKVGFEKPVRLVAILHFFAAVLTFFISISIL